MTQSWNPTRPDIAEALASVRETIALAARESGRGPEEVALVAVAKTFGPSAVEAAYAAGQRVFGENRVQEAQSKYPDLKKRHPDLMLHLIGPLQTNKAGDALALFDVIETLDREKLARALAKERDRQGRCPQLYIQVNTGGEAQKAGCKAADAAALLQLSRDELNLPVIGLMCIPPLDEPPAVHFGLLKRLAQDLDLENLSMGMSGDYEAAVMLGATSVRVGSAIFGQRPKPV
ncbi:YggS family pyridoxal phosphate-dependent enzyme [Algihabitans albus]|uniref:YggS family pyridoxal phosphate-dependent enzyme n=1 Tax=Algihabitans albus TaxID=2164067 RepID=UPI000E5CEF49|nr:YggS family pyridoxal phosphate-dependent enzyme [Algihabitans albus]